jgi:hypothetical protein
MEVSGQLHSSPLYPAGKEPSLPRYLLDRSWVHPQSRSGLYGGVNILYLSGTRTPLLCRPTHTILLIKLRDLILILIISERFKEIPVVLANAKSRAVVPNLWYAYRWGYMADRLGVRENNIGNVGKHQKKS